MASFNATWHMDPLMYCKHENYPWGTSHNGKFLQWNSNFHIICSVCSVIFRTLGHLQLILVLFFPALVCIFIIMDRPSCSFAVSTLLHLLHFFSLINDALHGKETSLIMALGVDSLSFPGLILSQSILTNASHVVSDYECWLTYNTMFVNVAV